MKVEYNEGDYALVSGNTMKGDGALVSGKIKVRWRLDKSKMEVR